MSHQHQAEKILRSLADFLIYEGDLMGNLEVDEISEGISIISSRGQYLLSYHSASNQIWLSSPVSGAHHFSYLEGDNKWCCTRSPNKLTEFLLQELNISPQQLNRFEDK